MLAASRRRTRGEALVFHLAEANMAVLIARFMKDQSGATAIEYSLIAASIAGAIIAAVRAVGTNVNAMYTNVANVVQ